MLNDEILPQIYSYCRTAATTTKTYGENQDRCVESTSIKCDWEPSDSDSKVLECYHT